MTQSAHSACVRCREHLLKGCGRTDGFWQSRGRVAREVFINRAQRVCPETKRTASSWDQTQTGRIGPPVKCSHCELRFTDARRTSEPTARGFESATRCLEQREAGADKTHQQTRPGWLARAALILRPAPTSPTRETIGFVRYLFAILPLNLVYANDFFAVQNLSVFFLKTFFLSQAIAR